MKIKSLLLSALIVVSFAFLVGGNAIAKPITRAVSGREEAGQAIRMLATLLKDKECSSQKTDSSDYQEHVNLVIDCPDYSVSLSRHSSGKGFEILTSIPESRPLMVPQSDGSKKPLTGEVITLLPDKLLEEKEIYQLFQLIKR
jgi:hypothetical protein